MAIDTGVIPRKKPDQGIIKKKSGSRNVVKSKRVDKVKRNRIRGNKKK